MKTDSRCRGQGEEKEWGAPKECAPTVSVDSEDCETATTGSKHCDRTTEGREPKAGIPLQRKKGDGRLEFHQVDKIFASSLDLDRF